MVACRESECVAKANGKKEVRMGSLVYVGMSGGVDSALCAALLVEKGYRVRGIYMRNWSRDLPGFACP